jgi:hypothetical protein
MLYQLGGVPALAGIPFGPKAKYYFVDPVNGDDANPGTDLAKPLKGLEAAYAKTVSDQHDCVFFIAGDTATNPAASITWSNDYTHLIGVGCNLPGLGQRCRVVGLAATALSPLITFSGTGCIVKNMQFNNEYATGAVGVAVVTGLRNLFENCFFMAPSGDTAASYSLKVSGSENVFNRCTIGQFTNFRANASYGLWLFGPTICLRNKFIKCEFLSWNSGTHVHVFIDSGITVKPWVVFFEDCLFLGNNADGTILAQAIDDNCTAAGHQIVLRGHNDFGGCTVVGDTLTYTLHAEMTGTKSGLLMAAVNES